MTWFETPSIVPLSAACTGDEPLGLESGLVLNQQMTASSQKSSLYAPFNARLNRRKVQERKGGWSPLRSNTNEYLQIDFNQNVKITRVATQGRRDWNEWVITYTLQYSADGQSSFQTYQENGIDKVFSGNSDRDTIVTHTLMQPIEARYVQINPKTWHRFISMRAEFYGCRLSGKHQIAWRKEVDNV